MSLKYKIYPQKSLLVDVLYGPINLLNLNKFHETYRNDDNIFNVNKVLTNLIGANFEMSINEMLTYIEDLKKEQLPPSFKWAILTETPKSTMFSMLIKDEPMFKNKVEVFSTLKSCLTYLNIHFHENEFQETDYIEFKN